MGIRQTVATGEHEEDEDDEGALRRVRANHITRENMRRAIVTVVNATFTARDPRWWGKATTTAGDSKRFGSWDSSEVAAMIEGLLRHCTDAEIEVNHTDTHGAFVVGLPSPNCSGSGCCPG